MTSAVAAGALSVVEHNSRVDLDSVVDIVIPVYNEERDPGRSVARLDDYLNRDFPYSYCITTIADNAGTDGTWAEAERLVAELPRVRAVSPGREGPGPGSSGCPVSSRANIGLQGRRPVRPGWRYQPGLTLCFCGGFERDQRVAVVALLPGPGVGSSRTGRRQGGHVGDLGTGEFA